jgi:hypothetical protein
MKTANEEYMETRQDVRGLLSDIRRKVEAHDNYVRDIDWSYVGSMKHVRAELKEISEFLGE